MESFLTKSKVYYKRKCWVIVSSIVVCILIITFSKARVQPEYATLLDIDPRVHGANIVNNVSLYHQQKEVYYDTRFFLYENERTPLKGTCPKYTPKIDPYEMGRPKGPNAGCVNLHFSNKYKQLPLVALASAPGSGNTWMRHLIEQLTGLYTGAIYKDSSLSRGGFLGEGRSDRSVVVVKTHEHWSCSRQWHRRWLSCPRYKKAILILRDPHQTILAEFNRYNTDAHTGSVNQTLYQSARWQKAAMILAKRWLQTFEVWSRFRNYKDLEGCVLIVSFKRLQTRLREELIRIGKFLGVQSDFLHGEHLDCVVRNSKGKFKRSQQLKPSYDIFDNTMNRTIDNYKKRVNSILTYLKVEFTI